MTDIAAYAAIADLLADVGAYAGLLAFLGLSVLAFLTISQGRDLRRLREWAGGAPERDAALQEVTSVVAAERAEELAVVEQERRRVEEARRAEERAIAEREQRRRRREMGLAEASRWERLRANFGGSFQGERRLDPRYLAGLIVAVIVLGGGVAFAAILLLGGDGDGSSPGGEVRNADIEVAVLNGTAVFGLADRTSDEVSAAGFTLGKVGNSDSSFSESIVMFTVGHKPEADRVATALAIDAVRPMSEEIAADVAEDVAVVVGDDRASGAPG
jgi:LytR cell envelope-related transcriptional attenuator